MTPQPTLPLQSKGRKIRAWKSSCRGLEPRTEQQTPRHRSGASTDIIDGLWTEAASGAPGVTDDRPQKKAQKYRITCAEHSSNPSLCQGLEPEPHSFTRRNTNPSAHRNMSHHQARVPWSSVLNQSCATPSWAIGKFGGRGAGVGQVPEGYDWPLDSKHQGCQGSGNTTNRPAWNADTYHPSALICCLVRLVSLE